MKSLLLFWATKPANLPEWFVHEKVMEVSPDQIIELYNTGNNVMLRHVGDSSLMTIMVDDRAFTQR